MRLIAMFIALFLAFATVGYLANRFGVRRIPSAQGRLLASALVRALFYTPAVVVGHGAGILPTVLLIPFLFETGLWAFVLAAPAFIVFFASLVLAHFGIGVVPSHNAKT